MSIPVVPPLEQMDLSELSASIAPILRKHGVRSASVFGSTARGEAGPDSDLDLLVEYPEGMGALRAAALKRELEELLGRRVDLVPPKYLRAHVRPSALAEQVRLYG